MEKNKPVDSIRIANLTAAIWKNETENGARYNVTFQRSYRDGNSWKTSDSFGSGDLLPLAKLADQAHSRIVKMRQTDKDQEPDRDQEPVRSSR